MHQLYTFRRCPYAMRARLALTLIDEPFHAIEVDLKNKPASLLEVSPKATVPVLYINKEKIIDESLDIMLWVIQKGYCNWLNNEKEKQSDIMKYSFNILMNIHAMKNLSETLLKDAKLVVRSFEEAKGWAPGTLDLKITAY